MSAGADGGQTGAGAGAAAGAIMDQVRALYERHPYPHYPLLARPRWRDGWHAGSPFAARLITDITGREPPAGQGGGSRFTVLVGGAGEILPYVIRRVEPGDHRVINVDLSRASLARARFRCLPLAGRSDFVTGDLDDVLTRLPAGALHHVDLYGVLHHLPNPTRTLRLLARTLVPRGTMRVMVYNSAARTWITELQRLLALMAADPRRPEDLRFVRRLLRDLAALVPALAERLDSLGAGTLGNPARLADTLLHPREARLNAMAWWSAFESAGLTVAGMLDRYAELDDLPNPLWQAPNPAALMRRAADRRLENNFELWLQRAGASVRHSNEAASRPRAPTLGALLGAPPTLWWSFLETADTSWVDRRRLWHAHLQWVLRGEISRTPSFWQRWPLARLQRLARIGAILPGMVAGDPTLNRLLQTAMADRMETPPRVAAVDLTAAGAVLTRALADRGRLTPRRQLAAFSRLTRLQSS